MKMHITIEGEDANLLSDLREALIRCQTGDYIEARFRVSNPTGFSDHIMAPKWRGMGQVLEVEEVKE